MGAGIFLNLLWSLVLDTARAHTRAQAEDHGASSQRVPNPPSVAPPPDLNPPRSATGVSRALQARSVPGVSLAVSLGPFGPGAPECPKSVPRVFPECQKGVPDTPGTLSGHFFGHSGARGPKGPRDTPRETSGSRDSCSRSGGVATLVLTPGT